MNIISTISTSTIVGEEGFGFDSKLIAKKKKKKKKQILIYILSSPDKGVGKNMILSLDLEVAVKNYKLPPKIIQIVNLS